MDVALDVVLVLVLVLVAVAVLGAMVEALHVGWALRVGVESSRAVAGTWTDGMDAPGTLGELKLVPVPGPVHLPPRPYREPRATAVLAGSVDLVPVLKLAPTLKAALTVARCLLALALVLALVWCWCWCWWLAAAVVRTADSVILSRPKLHAIESVR